MRALVLFLLLGACAAPRGVLVPVSLGFDTDVRPVYTAALRADENGSFLNARSETLQFQRLDITIPKNRDVGDVTFPTNRADPTKDMLLAGRETFATDQAYFNATDRAGGETMLFIHGFNNNYAEGVLRAAQMVEDFQFDGAAAHFSWASAASARGYAFDSDSATQARDALEQVLRGLLARDDVIVIAHSMGARLFMEVLRQMAIAGDGHLMENLSGVILMSPDIDVDVFRAQAQRIGALPEPFVIFTSGRDKALRISAAVRGLRQRLGNLDTLDPVADFNVNLVDFSEIPGGDRLGHFTAATSPDAIRIIRGVSDRRFSQGRPAGFPDNVVWEQKGKATRVILRPPGS